MSIIDVGKSILNLVVGFVVVRFVRNESHFSPVSWLFGFGTFFPVAVVKCSVFQSDIDW